MPVLYCQHYFEHVRAHAFPLVFIMCWHYGHAHTRIPHFILFPWHFFISAKNVNIQSYTSISSCNLNECPLKDSVFWLFAFECVCVCVCCCFCRLCACICLSSFERNFNFICQTKCWNALQSEYAHTHAFAQHTFYTYYTRHTDGIFIPRLCQRVLCTMAKKVAPNMRVPTKFPTQNNSQSHSINWIHNMKN